MKILTLGTKLFNLSVSTFVLALGQQAIAQGAWQALSSVNAPSARIFYHANTAIWTGSEMLIWGGTTGADQATVLGDGAAYNPTADSWTPLTATGAPSPRFDFTTVWTGSEMIVWGGYGGGSFNTGARYNPTLNTWTPISTTAAPSARSSHTAVWTGSEMIVWGGYGYDGSYHMKNDGARYNPVTDTWAPMSAAGAPSARALHASVWTGAEMIIWGGLDIVNFNTFLGDGARYNPVTDTWTPVQSSGAPSPRCDNISAVWSGNEMIILGGQPLTTSASGARYNPTLNTWIPISTSGAPSARVYNSAIWTGSEMIYWGGQDGSSSFNDGARYNPVCNSWTPITLAGAPSARNVHAAVWTGNQMIIWGGSSNTYLGAATGYLDDTYSYTVGDEPTPPAIVEISIPPNSQNPASRPSYDNVWLVNAPPFPLAVNTGIGIIVNPTVVGGNNNTDFALHQNDFIQPSPLYIAPHVPNPGDATVTYRFDQATSVSGVEIVQHYNGITKVEGFLGNSLAAMTSLGAVFGPSGDVTSGSVAGEAQSQIFSFNNSSPSGTIFQLVVRKTVHPFAFANYRIFPLDQNGNRIPVAADCGQTDTTPPTITCPADLPVSCSVDRLAAVSYPAPTATDDSGVPPTVTCTPASGSASFAVGVNTVVCTAVDAAGNSAQCSFLVTRAALGFTGFLPPIGGEVANGTGGSFDDPVRAFKLGSKIPVAFQASCGGSPVTTGAHTLQLTKHSSTTDSDPAIDATPPGAATTGNQFFLADATTGTWHFTLDTKPLSVGTWKLAVTLSDGSVHEVWITIKK